jgi:hypothetical protein
LYISFVLSSFLNENDSHCEQIGEREPGTLRPEMEHMSEDKRLEHRLHEMERAAKRTDGRRWVDVDIDWAVALFYVRDYGVCIYIYMAFYCAKRMNCYCIRVFPETREDLRAWLRGFWRIAWLAPAD